MAAPDKQTALDYINQMFPTGFFTSLSVCDLFRLASEVVGTWKVFVQIYRVYCLFGFWKLECDGFRSVSINGQVWPRKKDLELVNI